MIKSLVEHDRVLISKRVCTDDTVDTVHTIQPLLEICGYLWDLLKHILVFGQAWSLFGIVWDHGMLFVFIAHSGSCLM